MTPARTSLSAKLLVALAFTGGLGAPPAAREPPPATEAFAADQAGQADRADGPTL